MPLKGKTFRTKHVLANLVIAIGQKLPESSPADRTFYLVTPVKDSRKPHKNHADPYQPGPWDKVYEERNNFFHI